ncbi:MAG: hypothetical protein R2824_33765 [Saprospiraceae bacterium]
MRIFPVLIIGLFVALPQHMKGQDDYEMIICPSSSLFQSDTYVNDLCTVSYNFILGMNSGDLDAALTWSDPECFLDNSLEDYDQSVISTLSLLEKKELLQLLGGVTKSLLEGRRSYTGSPKN